MRTREPDNRAHVLESVRTKATTKLSLPGHWGQSIPPGRQLTVSLTSILTLPFLVRGIAQNENEDNISLMLESVQSE